MNFKEDKLRSSLLEEINSILTKRQDLKEIALITITDVEIIDEGRAVNVYFSVFNETDQEIINDILIYLNQLTPEIRQTIRKRIKTRFVPNVNFFHDKTPERASRIEEILKKIELERNNAGEDKRNGKAD